MACASDQPGASGDDDTWFHFLSWSANRLYLHMKGHKKSQLRTMRKTAGNWLFLFLITIWIPACKSDHTTVDASSVVNVRLPSEPDMLNPARSSSSFATQIESLIMYPLAEQDPQSYELSPLLIESLPAAEPIRQGPDSGGVAFRFRIRKEATWDDGSPITGHDYAFTVKMAMNPKVDVAQWRGFLTLVTDVQIDPQDPQIFSVIISEPYFLAEIVAANFNIYPAYIYDSTGYLTDIPVRLLTDPERADSLANVDPRMQEFASSFMQVRFAKETVSGSGPYRLVSWETGQRIILERKTDWWGDRIKDKPAIMNAFPGRSFTKSSRMKIPH
jgi:peptide/nickel transport system substrate-binding protein